ncbi:hypothetical protein HYY75_06680 [bacterium]|nr:hypothetical protein [bacterium]
MIFDDLFGKTKKELETVKKDCFNLSEKKEKVERELDQVKKRLEDLFEKNHIFFERIKALIGCLDSLQVLDFSWALLESALGIKKGAIFTCTESGWRSEVSKGFPGDNPPIIPLEEESIPVYSAKHGVILSLAHVRSNPDLAFLERRGIISDVKIACPIRKAGVVEKLIVVCQYSGNVFAGEDEIELLKMVASLMGLVMTNAEVIAEQKKTLNQRTQELAKLRGIFSHMVAPEVVEFIESNPEGIVLGGSRQKVAIFFADIRGFTPLSEKLPPERVIELLNRHFSLVTDTILKFRGTLDKFMGDAAMVLFGTPIPLENPCLSAVKAAIEMQRNVQKNMAAWVGEGFPAFSMGIGINYQEVIVGHVGSKRLSNFTVIGDGVNLASRLCGLAAGGEIIVSQFCIETLKDWVGKCEERPGVVVKGKSQPITVFAVSAYEDFVTGPCRKCGTEQKEGVRFCGVCGYQRY